MARTANTGNTANGTSGGSAAAYAVGGGRTFKSSHRLEINADSWRPGMNKKGWIVRYGVSVTGGTKYQKTFDTEAEAIKFQKSIEK